MPKRINVENAVIPLGRASELLVDGYPMALVQTFQDTLQSNDQTVEVLGTDNQIVYTIIDGANLSVSVVADPQSNNLYDIATGQDPAGAETAMRGYYPNERVRMDVVRNFKTEDGTGYGSVVFYGNWEGLIKMPTGGPKEHGQIRLDGRCKAPIEIRAPKFTKIAGVGNVVPLIVSADGKKAIGMLNLQPTALPAMPPLRGYESGALSIELQAADARARGAKVNATRRIPVLAGSVTPFPSQAFVPITNAITEEDLAVPVDVKVASTAGWPAEGGCYIQPAEGGGGQEGQYEVVDATTLRVYRTGDTLGTVQGDPTFQAGDLIRFQSPKADTDGASAPGTIAMKSTVGVPEVGQGYVWFTGGPAKLEKITWTGKTANALTGVARSLNGRTLTDEELATAFVGPFWNHLTITEDEAAQVGLTLAGAPAAGNRTIATRAYVQFVHTPDEGDYDGYQGGRCLLGDGIPFDGRYD